MSDPYDLSERPVHPTGSTRETTRETTRQAPPAGARAPRRAATTALWLLLGVALAVDLLSSGGFLPVAVGIASGVVVLACATALVVARVRRR